MKHPENRKEAAKYAAACAFLLPGICAELAVIIGHFSASFPALLAAGFVAFSACVSWKL